MSVCKSCGAAVIWAVTDSGRRMPLDANPIVKGVSAIGTGRLMLRNDGQTLRAHTVSELYQSHFSTCPDSDKWRESER